jgi:Helix-turn-helix domain
MADQAPCVPPLALRSRDAAMALGITERTVIALADAGAIRCVRLGTVTIFPVSCLRAWLDSQATPKPVQ